MEIQNYREQPIGGKIVALFDIYMPNVDITLRNWKLIRGKSDKPFPVSPSFCEDVDGQKKWTSLVEVGARRRDEFYASLKAALEPFIKGFVI